MTDAAVQGINAALAVPVTARPIVEQADSPLAAVQAAGIPINGDERTFLDGIAPYWNKLQSGILAAYDAGRTPQVTLANADAYSVDDPVTQDGSVLLTLRGPLPPGAG